MRRILAVAVLALALAGAAGAQERRIVLAADARLADSGLLDYLLPRFSLKHQVKVTLAPGAAGGLTGMVADVVLAPRAEAERLQTEGRVRPAMHVEGGETWSVVARKSAGEHAETFADWLTSDIGQRTVAGFAAPGAPVYLPGAVAVALPEAPLPEGDASEGEKLAHFHCGRCHVISARNRFSGIGSAPSFAAMRNMADWQDRFLTFWSINPHPVFTQVEGLTEPFDPARPPHIAPVEMTLDDLDAILAFTGTIAPKDLGAEIELR